MARPPRRVDSWEVVFVGTMPRDEKERKHFANARAREAKQVAVDAHVFEATITQTKAPDVVATAVKAPATGGSGGAPMSEVVPGVFVGGIDCVSRVEALADARVSFLLSCCLEATDLVTVRGLNTHAFALQDSLLRRRAAQPLTCMCSLAHSLTRDPLHEPTAHILQPLGITHHLRIAAADISEANLLSCFDKCIDFIRQAIDSESAVLVHCVSGVSRSPAIAMVSDLPQHHPHPRAPSPITLDCLHLPSAERVLDKHNTTQHLH